jgi:ubiquinone/menaquinone biosynthesis C-methylase UbiE
MTKKLDDKAVKHNELSATAKADVQEYYGEVLGSSDDLKTSACCLGTDIPPLHKKILSMIHDDVLSRFYGCGSPIPSVLEGKTVLDLGCGTGRDVYLLSKLVGPKGKVIGVDMTPDQINVGRRVLDEQMERFGFDIPNVEFLDGEIEDLAVLGIKDHSIDIVVSNCVINLSPDKKKVFEEIYRVLKDGGELYFSDVFSDRRLPKHLREDKIMLGECLGGALYKEDFRRLMADVGFPDVRVLEQSRIDLKDQNVIEMSGNIRFDSLTVRAFKCPETMEDRCEDYGQVAIYKGGIMEEPHAFRLDDHHLFEKGRPMLVCGNTAAMLEETRYAPFFQVSGNRTEHFGLFDCGPEPALISEGSTAGACC